jgi:hypothetical protein
MANPEYCALKLLLTNAANSDSVMAGMTNIPQKEMAPGACNAWGHF